MSEKNKKYDNGNKALDSDDESMEINNIEDLEDNEEESDLNIENEDVVLSDIGSDVAVSGHYVYLVVVPFTNEKLICASDSIYYKDTYVVVPGRFGLELGLIKCSIRKKTKGLGHTDKTKICGACNIHSLGKMPDYKFSCCKYEDNEFELDSGGSVSSDPEKIMVSNKVPMISHTASNEEIEHHKQHLKDEKNMLQICRDVVERRKMDLKVVDCHLLLHERKLIVFFTSDKRVDFRELVKELAGILKMRLELRKISERDETRQIGGMGLCGRDFCCHGTSIRKKSITIQMAKYQNFSLNTTKISGPCEKLLCCLAYENEFYTAERLNYPPEGTKLMIGQLVYTVAEINVLASNIVVKAQDSGSVVIPCKYLKHNNESGNWEVDERFQRDHFE